MELNWKTILSTAFVMANIKVATIMVTASYFVIFFTMLGRLVNFFFEQQYFRNDLWLVHLILPCHKGYYSYFSATLLALCEYDPLFPFFFFLLSLWSHFKYSAGTLFIFELFHLTIMRLNLAFTTIK